MPTYLIPTIAAGIAALLAREAVKREIVGADKLQPVTAGLTALLAGLLGYLVQHAPEPVETAVARAQGPVERVRLWLAERITPDRPPLEEPLA